MRTEKHHSFTHRKMYLGCVGDSSETAASLWTLTCSGKKVFKNKSFRARTASSHTTLSFFNARLLCNFAKAALSSGSHLYSSRLRGIKCPDPQGQPCIPIPWTYTNPAPTSKILGCKNQALKRRDNVAVVWATLIQSTCVTVLRHSLTHPLSLAPLHCEVHGRR